jgi:hypothetical protein
MIFAATWEAVLNGTKTETRRICKPGEWLAASLLGAPQAVYVGRLPHERLKWMVGRTYAVQTGRGNPGLYYKRTAAGLSVWNWDSLPQSRMPRNIKTIPSEYIAARIRLLEIRQERLQDIDDIGALMEGIEGWKGELEDMPIGYYYDHFGWWGSLDYDAYCDAQEYSIISAYANLWDSIHTRKGERWDDNPLCWVLRFELAEDTK